jgi:hypothetical protein
MLNDASFLAAMTAFFADLDPASTAATKAAKFCPIIKDYIKSASIKAGTLQSNGQGNLGAPVSSVNETGGRIE